jgi:hypothetical protein
LDKTAPRGIHHHYARLSIATFPNSAPDCRTEWPPSTGKSECGCCCTCTAGDGVNTFGKYTSINDAINALPEFGGEVCILPGHYFENVLIQGAATSTTSCARSGSNVPALNRLQSNF